MPLNSQDVTELLKGADFEVLDRCEIPSHPSELRPVPEGLDFSVSDRLRHSYPDGLYKHQAAAIEAAIKGSDIVLASATASGG